MDPKNYVIVGGSKGIGLSIVKRLSEQGNNVTVLSRSHESLNGIAHCNPIEWDATKDDFPVEQVAGDIHGMVYCPGTLNLRSFKSLKPEVFRDDFELNVVGAIKSIQGCLPGLKSAGQSSVLLFSTVAVGQGMFAHASIAVSKGAIEGLTRTLAAELSPSIRVNCLAPALTDTHLTQRFFSNEEKAAALAEKYPLGRTGKPDDMAAMACFLLGEESGWVTGQVIGVDGGMSTVRK